MSELRHPDAIRQDIESSRQELADSVEALAAKVNVKARARRKFDDGKRSVRALWQVTLEHKALAIGAGTVVVVVVLLAAARASDR